MGNRLRKLDACWEYSVLLVEEHGRVINTHIGQGHIMTLTYSDGHKLIIDELCSEVPVAVNIYKSAVGNYSIDIDSDNDTETATFKVTKDNQGTTLFTVNEDGSISFSNGMEVSAAGVVSGVTVADPTTDQQIASKKYVNDQDAAYIKHSLAMAASDFLVASGPGVFVKKTLGETRTILQCLLNLAEDTTPQLGGDLDLNGKNIDFPSVANISDVKDEDDLASDSATMLATQQSIKAYIDSLHQSYDTGGVSCDDWTNQHLGTSVGGNVVHSLNTPLRNLIVKVFWSTDGTDNNTYEWLDTTHILDGAGTIKRGIAITQVDDDNIIVQTGDGGITYIRADGTFAALVGDAGYYRIVVYKMR